MDRSRHALVSRLRRHGAAQAALRVARSAWLSAALGIGLAVLPTTAEAGRPRFPTLSGLHRPATVLTDELGVPHIYAASDHDVVLMQGYLHARDRFFQMDANRRAANGTLAELTGNVADLASDGFARLMGFRRAAERSLALLPPAELALAQAYADGVNAWLHATPALPREYGELEITVVPDWTPLDTFALGHAAAPDQLDLWQIDETAALEGYICALGDEAGTALYYEDLARFAPWVPRASVPDALGAGLAARRRSTPLDANDQVASASSARRLANRARAKGVLAGALAWKDFLPGSNAWGIVGARSTTGRPLVAGDGHANLTSPARDYEIHAVGSDPVAGPLDVTGSSQPGVPGLVSGQNPHVAWESTRAYHDVSDVFLDRLVRGDPACPTRLCIVSGGEHHAVEERLETYRVNVASDGIPDNSIDFTELVRFDTPEAVDVLVVPFRSFGPFLQVDDRSVVGQGPPAETTGLTLQSTLLHAGQGARFVLGSLRARDVYELAAAAERSSSLANFVFADRAGNLAFYTTGDVPLRSDLEAGAVVGLPPFLIRDGSGPNNWVPDPARSQGQAVPFAVVPPAEMPHVVNPPAGFVVNSNEDASGFVLDNDLLNQQRPSNPGAIHYLGATPVRGLRNGRVTALLQAQIDAGQLLSLDDMMRIQGDTVALHAELLVPHLQSAFASASRVGAPSALAALAADARIVEAIGRLTAWDYSHPTGVADGYDPADVDGVRGAVSPAEVADSVAAAIYNVWFTKLLTRFRASVVPLGLVPVRAGFALAHLLSQQPFTGVGASGVDFFPVPAGLSAADRRDVMLLGALRDALIAMAGSAYAAAFGLSTNQQDYRWGLLHRVLIPHRLGGTYSIPPAAGFDPLSATLSGLSRGGTWDTVDVSPAPGLPDTANAFPSSFGAISRHVRSPRATGGVEAFSSFLGGPSGDPASPDYASQLGSWLTSDYRVVAVTADEVIARTRLIETFVPGL